MDAFLTVGAHALGSVGLVYLFVLAIKEGSTKRQVVGLIGLLIFVVLVIADIATRAPAEQGQTWMMANLPKTSVLLVCVGFPALLNLLTWFSRRRVSICPLQDEQARGRG